MGQINFDHSSAPITFANPTALVGLAPVNGVATSAMRSDAAPALDVSIAPTWTGQHIFANARTLVRSATWFAATPNLSVATLNAFGSPGTYAERGVHLVRSSSAFMAGIAFGAALAGGVPAPAASGAPLMSFRGSGYADNNVANFIDGAQIDFVANEAWTPTANGSRIDFVLIPNGSTTQNFAGRFDGTNVAGQTRFMVYDVDNGTLERVTVGAADSGGVGFKLLRIPN